MYPFLTRPINLICAWLENTSLSQTIQVKSWIVPTVQTVHILAIAAVAGSALMIDLRLIGLAAADQPLKDVSARFMPFIWWSLLVLLATGAILITGEPPRSLKNPVFQLKMTLLIGAVIVTAALQLLVRRDARLATPGAGQRRLDSAALAILSMLLWCGIIFAGRWIAYFT